MRYRNSHYVICVLAVICGGCTADRLSDTDSSCCRGAATDGGVSAETSPVDAPSMDVLIDASVQDARALPDTESDALLAVDSAAAADAGPCEPGPSSLHCSDDRTFSLCSEDADFDGMSDGPPSTVEITCAAFFRGAGAATCESFDDATSEAICTMDDGGPCGVILVSGQVTTARCTTDDAVCLLDLSAANYLCASGTGIVCPATGDDFVPFCAGERLVWRCSNDGDGIGQPHVDDCAELGNGVCNAADRTCTGIEVGGRCNSTEWLCAEGLECRDNVCEV